MDAWKVFKETCLIPEGDTPLFIPLKSRILLAVSGGADSVCMAHMFFRLSKLMPLKLHIITFNHNLRKEADKEVTLVKKLAEKLKIPFTAVSLDVKGYAAANAVSIETASRNLRYENLTEHARRLKYNIVATAHNANDNAETALMWLIRGTGTRGMGGVPVERALTKNIKVVRPILNITRPQIEAYVKKNKLAFCTDKSNLQDKFTRNKIRLRIIPEIEKINPSAVTQISSFTKIFERENAFLEILAEAAFAKCVKAQKSKLLLDLDAFLKYNEALRYRVLKKFLPSKNYTARIDEIMRLIMQNNSAFKDNRVYRFSEEWSFKINKSHCVFTKVKLSGN
ncbi:MAG: tRNA lysidine(34) synthetase TilS [Elusimicrobia bacterium]|nr:tRNA lysidine(34) synthetase TilS [Elusimicrobiota bacterium]